MTKYVYSAGDYSVIWDKDAFHVTRPDGCAAMVESSYAPTADGLGLAIGRARYRDRCDRAKEVIRTTGRNPEQPKDGRAVRKAEAAFCTEEGKRIFALGVRKAHAEWLDA